LQLNLIASRFSWFSFSTDNAGCERFPESGKPSPGKTWMPMSENPGL